jgi:predicted ester cyclase
MSRATATTLVETFNSGDLRDLGSFLSPDYDDHQGLDGRPLRGHEGFSTVVRAARGSVRDLRVTIEDEIAEADKVVLRLRWHSVSHSGESSERETIEILRVEGGLVVEHWGAHA